MKVPPLPGATPPGDRVNWVNGLNPAPDVSNSVLMFRGGALYHLSRVSDAAAGCAAAALPNTEPGFSS